MFNHHQSNNNRQRKLGDAASAVVETKEARHRRLATGTVAALAAIVLTGCGDRAATVGTDGSATDRKVSANLSDPGPSFEPSLGRLAEILDPRAEAEVEFGGMPAPVGEPDWRALVVAALPVEFGGMPAPLGEPQWGSLVAALPVEFGGMPAPLGEPKWLSGYDAIAEVGPRHGPR